MRPLVRYVAVTTLSRQNLQSEKTVVMHHYERGELTLTEQERLVNLRQDIRQAVVRLARQREIAWPRQPCSVPHSVLNQPSFRQLAKRRGKERSVLKLPGEKNDNVKEEETQKSSPVTSGNPLEFSPPETTSSGPPDASGGAAANPQTAPAASGR